MLKRLLCEAEVEITLKPQGPVLIKSGSPTLSMAAMCFVQTYRNGRTEVYLPGSSLKGVIRSHSEKICRTLNDKGACFPYANGEENYEFCGEQFQSIQKAVGDSVPVKLTTAQLYRHSCPACRLFGSTFFIGRCAISEAYSDDPPSPEMRDGVAIDRKTGGTVKGALFNYEVITGGSFTAKIKIRNFELWQLGLLALVIRDMQEERVQIGFGKSKGLGIVGVEIGQFNIRYFGTKPTHLCGIERLSSPEEIEHYGLFKGEKSGPELPEISRDGIHYDWQITNEQNDSAVKDIFEFATGELVSYMEKLEWPYNIRALANNGV